MEQIYQSSILQALGWALADSLWQMALLWLLYQVLVALPVRHDPVRRHLGATLALFLGGIWFLGNVVYKLIHAKGIHGIGNSRMDPSLMTWLESLLPYLSAAYLVVLLVLLVKFMHSIVNVQRLRVTETSPAGNWQPFVDDMALRFFIAKKVLIRISEVVDVPATIGYLKPVILLPLASVNNLTTAQIKAIIMHELAHIRRHDYLINLLVTLAETILFFNPFTHLLGRQIRKECELCCDDAVLSHKQDPGQYAYALLLLEKSRQQIALAMAATGTDGLLLGRVKRILKQPEQKVKYRQRVLALLLVAGLIMGLTLVTPTQKDETDSSALVNQAVAPADATRLVHPSVLLPGISAARDESPKKVQAPKVKKAAQTTAASEETSKPSFNELESLYAFSSPAEFPPMVEMPVPPPPPSAPKAPAAPRKGSKTPDNSTPFDMINAIASGEELAQFPQVLEGLTNLVRIRGMEEKELEALFKTFSRDKMPNEQELRQYNIGIQQWQKHWDEMNAQHREHVNAQRKLTEERIRMIKGERAAQQRVRIITPGRKIKGTEGQPVSPEDIETRAEKPAYRAYTFSGQTGENNKARVKTYKDENGFTISIVEEVGQIRIQFSSEK